LTPSNGEGQLIQYLSISISVIALLIAATTLWLTHIRRGKLQMTQPNVIFFGPDGSANHLDGEESQISKIYLRTLLYSTGKRGIVLEHLFVRLRRGETQQNFNIWVLGERELARGSGIFVPQEGIAANHHFLAPSDTQNFDFSAGDYKLEVYGKVVAKKKPIRLSIIQLAIDRDEAEKLRKKDYGIYFDWGPDAGRYQKKNRAPTTANSRSSGSACSTWLRQPSIFAGNSRGH
jgi:hypothetical protein